MATSTGGNSRPEPGYTLYILHFVKPYWRTCRHYIGYTSKPLAERLKAHTSGRGSKLVKYALQNGGSFVVAHTEKYGTQSEARQRELQIKRRRDVPKRICPICKAMRNGGSHDGKDTQSSSTDAAQRRQASPDLRPLPASPRACGLPTERGLLEQQERG